MQQPSLDFFNTEENVNANVGLGSIPRPKNQNNNKKTQNRGAGEQNAADLMKQHVQFTVCVCFLSDSTTLELTRPDGIISSLASSITETAPALQEAQ